MGQKFVEELSPQSGRQRPLSRQAGEGCRRRGEGYLTQGSRLGLLYAAPDGTPKTGAHAKDFLDAPLT